MLKDKIAVLTGGSSGIGRAAAVALAGEGAALVIGDIDEVEASNVAREIEAAGGTAVAMRVDVTRCEDNQRLVQEAVRRFGRIDIFLPIAGVNSNVSIGEMTEQEWDRVMDINLKGVFWGCQAVFKLMQEQGHGKIVTIASVAAKIGGIKSSIAYSASKAGVLVLTYSLAKLLAPYGCNVNCISPGPVDTPFQGTLNEDEREMLRKNIPLGRWARPEDIARAIVFLCSDSADYITGEVIDVNGGMLMD